MAQKGLKPVAVVVMWPGRGKTLKLKREKGRGFGNLPLPGFAQTHFKGGFGNTETDYIRRLKMTKTTAWAAGMMLLAETTVAIVTLLVEKGIITREELEEAIKKSVGERAYKEMMESIKTVDQE